MDQPSIREFLATHQEAFEKQEAKFNILLGLSLKIRQGRLRRGFSLYSFGRPGAAALQMEGRNLVLGDLSPEHCAKLASFYSNIPYPGVIGPDPVADWFAQSAGLSHFHPPTLMGIFQLDGSPKKPPVHGAFELAEDTYLVVKWLTAFHEEVEGREFGARDKDDLRKRAERGTFFFWEVEGEPVAMAAEVREGLRGAAIGAVYVPPEQRGHRYGEAVTAYLAESILKADKSFSYLYADLANPVSNKMYERIGYRLVCHSKTFRRK
jgi:GNAT superfamily N-acetyltransferase